MSSPDIAPDVDAELPVLATPRAYLRIRPSSAPVTATTAVAHLRRLHGLERDTETRSFLQRLRGEAPPTIEVLLVSAGGPTSSVDYYIGTDGSITSLERILRGLFPDTYEVERVDQTDDWLGAFLGGDDDHTIRGVEYLGVPEAPRDWQTCLTPISEFLTDEGAYSRVPLAAVVETMATTEVTVIYQALLRPKPDWAHRAEERVMDIRYKQDSIGGQLSTVLWGPPEDLSETETPSDRARIEELERKDTRRSFDVTARAVVIGDADEADEVAQDLAAAFGDVSHTFYEVCGEVQPAGMRVFREMRERQFYPPKHRSLSLDLSSRGIVADATEAPSFCLLDGASLTRAGARALALTPSEQSTLPAPPDEQLTHYREGGLPLGFAIGDGHVDADPVVLPPSLQPMHVAWFGKTGSGKSTSLINAILANHAATDGADILIDPKGDGMAEEYLRAHYATYGDLENVRYFDCSRVLPAFSFFDIRDQLDAGVPRTTAVEDTVDHYVEILAQIMGRERFEQAVRSPDIIRYLVKAAFDPINGQDAFSHRDLHGVVRRMHERQAAPAVSDDDLERMLGGVVANRAQTFDEIMQGVANRIEKIPIDQRLARIFNHVPAEGDPHFDLADYLSENVVIIFDTGSLRTEAQRVLTLVILSNLWTALRRRTQRRTGPHPLVNLYIEEAASVAVSDLLKQLLSQSRSFDCSVTLAMQFPAQLKGHNQAVYEELLNNISTFVTGNVAVDRLLTHRLATDDMDAVAVGNRLRALRRGQWLVSLPAGFDDAEPRPFLVRSLPLPPGHPDGPQPLSVTEDVVFNGALETVEERTLATAGLTLGLPSRATQREPAEEMEIDPASLPAEARTGRVDTALALTKRLPSTVEYDATVHSLFCKRCDSRYDPSFEGLLRTIECCSSLEEVAREDIPICALNLKLSPEERAVTGWSDAQLCFLQAVYNAQQLRYDPLEYDLLRDSMLRLHEYTGVEQDDVQDLIDAGVLKHDTDHPHRLYSVSPEGRSVLNESYREGVDYGHGKGDLEETTQHVFAVEVARQHLVRAYLENPDSPVTEVIPYYDLDANRRLDLAGLDDEGNFVVVVEVERINHDVRRAVPDDFDKMASCDADEAIWVVMTHADGHTVLQALNDPLEGPQRVAKTYASTTAPYQFIIDTPGLTAIYPVEWLRDRLDDDDEEEE